MNIVIIGTGNVASVLGSMLAAAGHTISQVFGRSSGSAAGLASQLKAPWCNSWDEIVAGADLYLLALSDQALHELPALRLEGGILVHTAGSVSIHVLYPLSQKCGVLYPLQSLRKEMPVLTSVPLLVNASDKETESKLLEVAGSLSTEVKVAGDEERLRYHVAAVFVNNFTNHLYAVAEAFCGQQGIEFNMLMALALETATRLTVASPAAVATGPAVRDDQVTIQKHLELLRTYPPMQKLYSQLTLSIQAFQESKNQIHFDN